MKGENESGPDIRERLREYSLRIIRMYSVLPRDPVSQVMGKQVLRSGTSVGANQREASRARSTAEFVAKIGDCLKELDETDYWLDLLVSSGTVSDDKLASLRDETNQLIAILTTISRRAKENS